MIPASLFGRPAHASAVFSLAIRSRASPQRPAAAGGRPRAPKASHRYPAVNVRPVHAPLPPREQHTPEVKPARDYPPARTTVAPPPSSKNGRSDLGYRIAPGLPPPSAPLGHPNTRLLRSFGRAGPLLSVSVPRPTPFFAHTALLLVSGCRSCSLTFGPSDRCAGGGASFSALLGDSSVASLAGTAVPSSP